ncbi:MAG: caspase family protein [Saprospiraceae bacterium]|nr:caspase family protein [Saprospiraceae bacterium]
MKHSLSKKHRRSVAVFHFSGHGQQVWDINGDELDGYDEAIVPYDSPMRFKAGVYEGTNLIRDEELGNMMAKLRKKLGKTGNVMLILDSCHSGTGTRGFATARGTDNIMADSQYIKSNFTQAFDENSLDKSKAVGLASMVSFFGASPNQLNYETISAEGKEVGSLSYAFSQTFAEADKGNHLSNYF